jgi:Na+/H+-translocating membrane pyrophosphatase
VGAAGGVVALLAGIYFLYSVLAEEQGNSEMRRLRGLIYDGARTYLFTQYRWLTGWAAIM